MRTILLATALAVSAVAVPATVQAQRLPGAVVAVVDTGRIYRECTACRAAQTQLQSLQTQMQQRAQALGQPLQTEAQSIEQAAQALRNQTGAARTAAETALQQRVQTLRQRETTANQELARLENNLRSSQANVLQQINQRLNPIISQAMTARGANLAVSTEATLAHAQTVDITADVLARLNQALPAVTVAPLPQQQQQQQTPTQGR